MDQTKSILIVDDVEDLTEALAALLEHEGYEVHCACDCRHALASIERHPPSLILSDCMMPDMSGMGLLTLVRADPGTKAIPFILMSAITIDQSSAAEQADGTLIKPFGFDELRNLIAVQLRCAAA